MALFALLVLCAFTSPAVSSPSPPLAGCSTAVGGGDCKVVDLNQSQCYNDKDYVHYNAMKKRCCPSWSGNSCSASLNLTGSGWGQCTSTQAPSTPSPSSNSSLTLSPLPSDCSTFNLTASWPEMESVTGYELVLSHGRYVVGYCTHDPGQTNITVTDICYDLDDTILNVELRKMVATGSSETVDTSSINRKNCYSLYPDTDMQLKHCGPKVSVRLDTSCVRISSAAAVDGLVNMTLSWPTVPDAKSYELMLTHKGYMWLNATATTEVTLTGLNPSSRYSLRIQPYMECAGMYLRDKDWYPCTGDSFLMSSSQMSAPHCTWSQPWSTTSATGSSSHTTSTAGSSSHTTSTAGSSSHTTSTAGSSSHTTSTAGSSSHTTSTAGSSSHTTSPAGSGLHFTSPAGSSLHFTSPTESISHTISPAESFAMTSTTEPTSTTSTATTLAITRTQVTVGVSVSLTVLLVLSLSTMFCAVYHKLRKHRRPSPVPDTPSSVSSVSSPPTEPSSIATLDGYISYQQFTSSTDAPLYTLDTPPPSPGPISPQVLVLYSLSTQEEQKKTINNCLVGGLRERYGMTAESPGTIRPRFMTRDWLELSISQAEAVLLVCNKQFYEEWTDRGSDEHYKLRIGWEVKCLKDGLKNADLAKFAYVHFEEAGCYGTLYPQLSPYFHTHFTLTGNMDNILESIAQFVRNSPEFE